MIEQSKKEVLERLQWCDNAIKRQKTENRVLKPLKQAPFGKTSSLRRDRIEPVAVLMTIEQQLELRNERKKREYVEKWLTQSQIEERRKQEEKDMLKVS